MTGPDDSMDKTSVTMIGNLLRSKGRPARIDSEYYQAKLREGAGDIDAEERTGLDRSLLYTVKKIHFVRADDMENIPETEQLQVYAKYSQMLTNLMEEGKQRKAPLPIRAPAQICVAAVVAAEMVRRGLDTNTLLILVEHLLEQLEYAAAYYLDAESAKKCSTLDEMLALLQRDVADADDSTMAASASLVVAFSNLLRGLIGVGDLHKSLAIVEEKGADGLCYFLDEGYRFFGLPPAVCKILEQRMAV